jgi:hypothetical protein
MCATGAIEDYYNQIELSCATWNFSRNMVPLHIGPTKEMAVRAAGYIGDRSVEVGGTEVNPPASGRVTISVGVRA